MKKPMPRSNDPEWTPTRLVRLYQSWIAGVGDEHNWENDTTQAIITRSLVENVWSRLTPQEKAAVESADQVLITHWQQVAELLLRPANHPRTHWWWYLDEGPQVYEEARKVTARN